MDSYALLLAATLNAGTVLALAALGLLVNEKAGIVNLGAEGMMLVAAVAGFATVVHTGNGWLGFGAGALAGALLAAAFGVLVIWLNTNQYATGLALSLFGLGFSAFVGIRYTQAKLGERPNFQIPGLADVPLLGPALFRQHRARLLRTSRRYLRCRLYRRCSRCRCWARSGCRRRSCPACNSDP